MDFEFIREQTPLYIEAAKLTLHMAVIGVLLAIVVGLVCSMIKYFRIPVLRQIVECYIELSRNTPLLIQLFFLYFGLPKIGIVLSSEQCAISGLAFLRHDPDAGDGEHHPAAGGIQFHSCILRQCDLSY